MLSVTLIILLLIMVCVIPFRLPYTINKNHVPSTGGGKNTLDIQQTTVLKGAAVLLILVGHVSGTFSTIIFTPLASAGVSLFLILSGFGLAESYKRNGLSHFWQKKIFRVLLPYAIIITILMVVKGEYSIGRHILEITGLSTSYWYVGYQMKWYIIFFLTMLILPQFKLTIFLVASVVMFFLLGALEIEQSIAFIIGVILSDNKHLLSKLSTRRGIAIFIISFVLATILLGTKQLPAVRMHIGSMYYSLIQMFQNVLYAISIIFLLPLLSKISRSPFLVFCGVISYEVYLVHFPFYGLVRGNLGIAILFIVCALICAYIFYLLNKQMSFKILSYRNLQN